MNRILKSLFAFLGQPVLERLAFPPGEPPRVLLYAASNVGLGPMLRLLRIARALRERVPAVNLMLITDSPQVAFIQNEYELAVVRLPGFRFREHSFKEDPVGLRLAKADLRRLRANLILTAVHAFQPHVFVMDTAPHGKRNELEPALKWLAGRPTIKILQMRDIPFTPEEADRSQRDHGRLAAALNCYDAIFIAGDRAFFNVEEEYDLPEQIRRQIQYLGFVVPTEQPEAVNISTDAGAIGEGATGPNSIDRMLAQDRRRIVASFGGGWESERLSTRLLDAYCRLTERLSDQIQLFLFTGPGMDEGAFARLQAAVQPRPDVCLKKFTNSFAAVLHRADLAFLQAGSTPFQILETDIPMILYTREYSTSEQQLRASRLGRLPGVRVIDNAWLEGGDLTALFGEVLAAPRIARQTGFSFNGVEQGAAALARLLRPSPPQDSPPLS